ncbi:MAG: helix-turn-helix domain-containing protein [Acidaminococcaceae bacterium]|nr:helix-turn-helix domain-containing protein [Acidaminococcaceae bacterium]
MKRKEQQPRVVPQRMLYPTGEACQLLCCSINFLKAEIADGKIGFIIRNNRKLIPASAIDKYISERIQTGGQS